MERKLLGLIGRRFRLNFDPFPDVAFGKSHLKTIFDQGSVFLPLQMSHIAQIEKRYNVLPKTERLALLCVAAAQDSRLTISKREKFHADNNYLFVPKIVSPKLIPRYSEFVKCSFEIFDLEEKLRIFKLLTRRTNSFLPPSSFSACHLNGVNNFFLLFLKSQTEWTSTLFDVFCRKVKPKPILEI